YKFTLAEIKDWLNKQAIHQLNFKTLQMIVHLSSFRPIQSRNHQLGRIY
ncbi:3399_t:CDS:1, partial [Funneliformis geosporum]